MAEARRVFISRIFFLHRHPNFCRLLLDFAEFFYSLQEPFQSWMLKLDDDTRSSLAKQFACIALETIRTKKKVFDPKKLLVSHVDCIVFSVQQEDAKVEEDEQKLKASFAALFLSLNSRAAATARTTSEWVDQRLFYCKRLLPSATVLLDNLW